MFVYEKESQCFWFNRSPLAEELEREYCLIGTILGLAIYNNVILDVHFPAVLFRKLCGKLASGLEDLEDGWPALAHGLQVMLTSIISDLGAFMLDSSFIFKRYFN